MGVPLVVIVGRTNVGKSTLFNRLSRLVKSITRDEEGVTRDFLKDTISWNGRAFSLVDTGGISLRKSQDLINEQVRKKALEQLEKADVVLFVCDGLAGVLPEDREIAKKLHKQGNKVILVINKADRKDIQENLHEFDRLGFKDTLLISASHGSGTDELLDAIIEHFPEKTTVEKEKPIYNIVLLGKPNVGKSSLMNELVRQERSIVADMPGTTREALSERVTFYKADINVTDTPGIRRQSSIDDPLEELMTQSALRAVREADIVLLLIDASQGVLSDQELKLAFYVVSQHKGLILLFNKFDLLVDEYKQKTLGMSIEEYPHLIKRALTMNISCKTGKNVGKIMSVVQKLWERQSQWFDHEQLSALVKTALQKKPLYHNRVRIDLRDIEQVKTAPITLVIKTCHPQSYEQTQLGFIENLLRKNYDLKGVPLRFIVRKHSGH